jgi:hypothetical protein
MHQTACVKLRASSRWYKKYQDSAENPTYFRRRRASHHDGTIDALSTVEAWKRRKRVVLIGALIQMATVGLILVGAAVVLFGSIFNPREADPMGMFGLPPVSAMTCRPVNVNSRAMRPIEIVSQRANREAA